MGRGAKARNGHEMVLLGALLENSRNMSNLGVRMEVPIEFVDINESKSTSGS
jgi:hypothetical protein